MTTKNDVVIYVIRDIEDAKTRSKEWMERCLEQHFGFVPDVCRQDSGKPFFADPSLGFLSVSHTENIYLLAVCPQGEIGIDAQIKTDGKDYRRVAAKYCPESEDPKEFFRLWTAKEACCKLTGEGLAGIRNVQVDLSPFRANISECGTVWLYDLSPAVGVPCTLAAKEEATWKVNDL